jgi:AraC-like DNA-binding protein
MGSEAWLLLDLLPRFAAIGGLALGMAIILRSGGRSPRHAVAAGFIACVIAYMILSSPLAKTIPLAGRVSLVALASIGAAMLWLTADAMFDDAFRLTWTRALPGVLLLACGLFAYIWWNTHPQAAFAARNTHKLVAVTLYALAIARAAQGFRGDLVEARRWFRLWFIGGASLLGFAVTIAELAYREQAVPPALELAKVGVILVLTMTLLTQLFDMKVDWLTAPAPPKPVAPEDEAVPPGERQLLAALREAMDVGHAYREEGLTIAELARRLKASEELLRRVINQRLGYRNFSAFLNERRIGEAKVALADLSSARKPILTIALEAGFGSIGPFNRAFREAVGETPTGFRRRALAGK